MNEKLNANLNFRQKIALQNARKLHALKKQVAVEHSMEHTQVGFPRIWRQSNSRDLQLIVEAEFCVKSGTRLCHKNT